MELNIDVLTIFWRHIPALIMVLTILVRLADEPRQLDVSIR
ncbi:MAG: hypothetical protein PVH03_14840 [Chloroflexota bacterium]|jgi:hypothetical protein